MSQNSLEIIAQFLKNGMLLHGLGIWVTKQSQTVVINSFPADGSLVKSVRTAYKNAYL